MVEEFFGLGPSTSFQAWSSKAPRHAEHNFFVLSLHLLALKVGG
jgi:hypothetical protein